MTLSTAEIWLVILGLGAGSYLLRLSFLGIVGSRELPEWLLRHLRYTAVAVMPGMITPMILFPTATGGQFDIVRMGAAIATIAISLWTRNATLTIFGGAAALFALHFLLAA
ncbi:MAG: branched chain amino acid exporter component AzlD [Roseibaca calidilacus]|uniref:Branched chain amino acid exporter component AzlD n=1 Tax=Roseibaca calidilacus TaxID=1666912 RepID=A0A0P7YSX9_9RHOB|nr:AzlD domain-containing protein [Roseibaca calidilacus]KPP92429.1 MAG: branched chain amino acid exporter component AzlD [Roseibaca calidilacus]CUX79725.1 Branched-chain amino acid transport protein [Roseibaca calidilacus]